MQECGGEMIVLGADDLDDTKIMSVTKNTVHIV
jgi:hypothetical protein